MKSKSIQKPVVGVGWYKEDQWDLLRENSEDRDELEDTYSEWVAHASDSVKQISKFGYVVEKIDIDVNELIEWCNKEKCVMNGESRSLFISEKTKDKLS